MPLFGSDDDDCRDYVLDEASLVEASAEPMQNASKSSNSPYPATMRATIPADFFRL
jgi:hypothetical protein